MPYACKASDLKIGDVIQVAFSGPYLSATVSRIAEKGITACRAYVTYHTGIAQEDWMTPLIGVEEMFYSNDDTVILWERNSGKPPTDAAKFEIDMRGVEEARRLKERLVRVTRAR